MMLNMKKKKCRYAWLVLTTEATNKFHGMHHSEIHNPTKLVGKSKDYSIKKIDFTKYFIKNNFF